MDGEGNRDSQWAQDRSRMQEAKWAMGDISDSILAARSHRGGMHPQGQGKGGWSQRIAKGRYKGKKEVGGKSDASEEAISNGTLYSI